MTMKFKMPSKEEAYRIKNVIREEAEMFDFVTVEDVNRHCTPIPQLAEIEDDDKTSGWRYADLVGNHFFVRKTKDGWFLFICDPRLNVRVLKTDEDLSGPLIDDETMAFLDRLTELALGVAEYGKDTRRKCIVTRAKKTIPAWFHCWTTNQIIKDDMIVTDLLAVCEFDDGHVERVKFDHVRFVDEWEVE